jgi:hypothetical protein
MRALLVLAFSVAAALSGADSAEDTETIQLKIPEEGIQLNIPEAGKELIEDLLNNMLPSLDEEVQETRRRNLGTNWAMFNQYFHGNSGWGRPVSCLAFFIITKCGSL